MKLSHLYTNKPKIFTPIEFKDGLNVVLARIYHPSDHKKVQHNLGKTLLIDVIDFCLLKSVGTAGHFLKKREDIFGDLVFFLEIELQCGTYVTVRRPVREATSIAFKLHAAKHQDFQNISEAEWDHTNVSLKAAVRLLDSFLSLSAIKPWGYRKGVGYFMRGQNDYNDVFRLSKFGPSKDIDWKPYVAKILGYSGTLLKDKYLADIERKKIEDRRVELQAETPTKISDYEKLRASITVKRAEVERKVFALDEFDFHSQETSLTQELADEVENQIVTINNLLYNTRFDLAQIQRSLKDEIHFDLANVKRVFDEASISFPEQLAKDYEDLVEFNRRILSERKSLLLEQSSKLSDEIERLEEKHAEISEKRREYLSILGGTDNLKKFKDLQRQLDSDRANLAVMEERVAKLQEIRDLDESLRSAKAKGDLLTADIAELLSADSSRFSEILRTFSHIVQEVLHRTAILYVKQNDSGNIDFLAEFTDIDTEAVTQEGRGTSFKQVLCIAFDLAILIAYAKEPFFHFVYHDGGLERLESKRKFALLKVIRDTCNQYNIQYILSTLEEDLPNIEDIDELCPKPFEIILLLHDGGDEGRLFKMPKF